MYISPDSHNSFRQIKIFPLCVYVYILKCISNPLIGILHKKLNKSCVTCLPWYRGNSDPSAIWRQKEEKEPVPSQMPPSLLPFCLSFFHFPGCLWTQPSPVVTTPGQAPPQVAVGSTLGQRRLAGPPKPRCLKSNLELQSRGNPKCTCPLPLHIHPPFKRHIFSPPLHMGLVIISSSSFGSKPGRLGLKSSYNSFPTFSSIRSKNKRKWGKM